MPPHEFPKNNVFIVTHKAVSIVPGDELSDIRLHHPIQTNRYNYSYSGGFLFYGCFVRLNGKPDKHESLTRLLTRLCRYKRILSIFKKLTCQSNILVRSCTIILLYLNPVIEALDRRRPIKHKNVIAKRVEEEKIQLEFQLEFVVEPVAKLKI
ncbi:Hypothetical predicted protein [Prunus dulcis]|uniref:Uncharacterized protein n=1 Tax=Prunus dulcis TaxID=3755 RepID=A0A5E4EGN3_PRUDU|nr:hypothetical protein L3X38_008375 [Prunus dulcis]VVA13741.1 Hypothetical predicted protein [Prunus dulcis]